MLESCDSPHSIGKLSSVSSVSCLGSAWRGERQREREAFSLLPSSHFIARQQARTTTQLIKLHLRARTSKRASERFHVISQRVLHPITGDIHAIQSNSIQPSPTYITICTLNTRILLFQQESNLRRASSELKSMPALEKRGLTKQTSWAKLISAQLSSACWTWFVNMPFRMNDRFIE